MYSHKDVQLPKLSFDRASCRGVFGGVLLTTLNSYLLKKLTYKKKIISISPEVLHYLRDMTDDVRAHGIKPIVILQGILGVNDVFSLDKIQHALPNVPVVDMSHFLINPKQHNLWFNLSHLNIKGRYVYKKLKPFLRKDHAR